MVREDAEMKRKKAETLTKQRATPRASATGTSPGDVRAPTTTGGRVNASPAARRLAQELGVDLTTVIGTGPGGMIGREDVQRAAAEAEVEAASSEEAEDKIIDVDGVAIHCLVAGPLNAPHIVFVHGLGGSLATWSLNMPAFADPFRICPLDLVRAGDSAKPLTDYSVNSLAN